MTVFGFIEELKAQWHLIVPSVFIYWTSILLWTVTFFVLGRLGEYALAGASLGLSVMNLVGNVMTVGMVSGLSILFTQAYGAGQMDVMQQCLHRGVVIVSILNVFIIALLLNVEPLLLLIGQEPELAAMAGSFMRWGAVGMWPLSMYDVLRAYFEAMSKLRPTLCVTILAFILNIFSNWLLVGVFKLGVAGVGASLVLSYWALFLFLLAYYVHWWNKPGWYRLSPEAFQKWPEFFSLAIPSLVMTFFEWGSFEVSLFLISYLGPSAIASQTIMMSAGYYLYMLPSAVATAAMTRVGNFLGAGDALGARRAAIVSGVASLVTGGFAGILLTVFGEYWPFVYTNDLKIAHVVIQMSPLLALFELIDSFQTVLGVIVRSSGRPRLGAILTALGFWGLSLPLGAFLTYRGGSVAPMWRGYIIGEVGLVIAYLVTLTFTDWHAMVEKAQSLVMESGDTQISKKRETDHLLGEGTERNNVDVENGKAN